MTLSSYAIARPATGKPVFGWQDDYAVGDPAMDDTHHEFVDCVDRMLRVEDDELAAALEAFAVHARRHFAEEDEAMRQSAYENSGCHIDEHAAILKSLDEVHAALSQGHVHVVRAFAQALADWFPEHASVMDMGLARWLVKRRLGGAPVVIRRSAALAS